MRASPVIAVAALLLLATASAQLDLTTGHIKPTPGVPRFEPAVWNAAFKVTHRNVPWTPGAADQTSNYHVAQYGCNSTGFDTTPASSVNVFSGSTRDLQSGCVYKNNTDNTFDYWVKYHGPAFDDANCYCYALNHFEGDFCAPGTSKGGRSRKRYLDMITCPALHQALVDDGAVPVTRQQALSGQPTTGHYIASMARPDGSCVPGHCSEEDYHFQRKDLSGTWSFKFPETPATDRDLEGRPITDPEAAPLPGHYVVCGYYQVDPMKMPTGSDEPTNAPLTKLFNKIEGSRNTTGVTISVDLSPYNPATDAVLDEQQQELNDEDLAWERKRGTPEYAAWLLKQQQKVELPTDGSALNGTDSVAVGSKPAGSKASRGRKLMLL